MQTKTIALMGQGKALLRLAGQENRLTWVLSPPAPAGTLYLVGPGGQVLSASLDADGQGEGDASFFPAAALVYDGQAFLLAGGFAGRAALLEGAKVSVRLLAGAAPRPAQTAGSPREEEAPGDTFCPPRPAPPPEAAPPQESPRNQSDALVEILQKAQELFHTEPASAPSSQSGPETIPNPFPRTFPQSRWQRVAYPGAAGHYLTGEGTNRGGSYFVYALPGEYAPVSSRPGFDRFVRAADGSGYWVRIVRK